MTRVPGLLSFALLLAGCGDDAATQAPAARDPQVAQALDDPLLTDPDLSARNQGGAALTVESDFSLPSIPATPEAIAAAKAEAAAMVGGADRLVPLLEPRGEVGALADDAPPRSQIAALPGGDRCVGALDRSAIWAARMPPELPVYPRGGTIDAAGSDAGGCAVRAVVFTTPVPIADVLAFYARRARAAGLAPGVARAGAETVLGGSNDRLAFAVRARMQGDHTLVRLATRQR